MYVTNIKIGYPIPGNFPAKPASYSYMHFGRDVCITRLVTQPGGWGLGARRDTECVRLPYNCKTLLNTKYLLRWRSLRAKITVT